MSDLLGLRLGLNALLIIQQLKTLNSIWVVYQLWACRLALLLAVTASVANTSMGGDLAALDGMFAVKQASLESPGGGVAQFLLSQPPSAR